MRKFLLSNIYKQVTSIYYSYLDIITMCKHSIVPQFVESNGKYRIENIFRL
jgi:hypothetical protein